MWRILRWFLGAGLLLAGAVSYCSWGSWEEIDVALPDDAGTMTFFRKIAHPYLAEFDYRIRLRLADGRQIASEIASSSGGQTEVLLHWRPAVDGKGPLLMLDERGWTSLVDIAAGRLDSNPIITTSGSPGWPYFGRIVDPKEQPGLRFVPAALDPQPRSRQ